MDGLLHSLQTSCGLTGALSESLEAGAGAWSCVLVATVSLKPNSEDIALYTHCALWFMVLLTLP